MRTIRERGGLVRKSLILPTRKNRLSHKPLIETEASPRPSGLSRKLALVNAKDRWLASLPSPNTRGYYAQIFAVFWLWAHSRYSPPNVGDPFDWLESHRAHELLSSDKMERTHCERLVSDWFTSLTHGDLDASSRTTYLRVVTSFFTHLLPNKKGRLLLRKVMPLA